MAQLEKIVDKLEHGDTTLEESLALFEQGSRLAENCRKQLEEAEGKIEILVKQRNGKLKAEPFDIG